MRERGEGGLQWGTDGSIQELLLPIMVHGTMKE